MEKFIEHSFFLAWDVSSKIYKKLMISYAENLDNTHLMAYNLNDYCDKIVNKIYFDK